LHFGKRNNQLAIWDAGIDWMNLKLLKHQWLAPGKKKMILLELWWNG
jgi:hypothetical protein